MDVALFFVFLICDLIIVPICWFSYGKQGEYREGMVMGVHIPAHAVEDPEVKKICGKIQKHWNRFHQINLLLSVLICFLCFYNFTLFIIVWSVWLAEYVAVLYGLIIVPHRQMYRLKLKRGWVDAASMRVVRIDTLSADQAPCYVDDDAYWKNGWYNNPDDRHILVQDRFNSMNYSFNYGRPAVKVILGVLAAVVAGIVIWVVSLLVSLENVQVTFQEEGGGYRFEAAGYECDFSGDDIQSVKLIDGLPDERFTRTNGGSTEKVNVGHFRGRETGKSMMFLYNDCTPILEIRLDDMTVFANSQDPDETEQWLEALTE